MNTDGIIISAKRRLSYTIDSLQRVPPVAPDLSYSTYCSKAAC